MDTISKKNQRLWRYFGILDVAGQCTKDGYHSKKDQRLWRYFGILANGLKIGIFWFQRNKLSQSILTECLIFTYCLFVEQKLVTIKHFLSSHLKPWKWVLFDYFQNISRNCHFVTHCDPLKKLRRKCLIVTDFFSTNKQYVKIKLMQNETNLCSIFLVKTKYW